MASNGKRMVKENLIKYLEAVQTNYPDPSDIGGGSGIDFTATNGLILQEIEGENYLGIDPATSIHFTGNYNGSIILDTTYINAEGSRNPLKFNIANNTNASLSFGYYDGGDMNIDYGAIVYQRPDIFNQRFVLNYQGKGGFIPIYFPKSNSTSFTAGSGAVNVAVGAKSGNTTIMANADGVIDLSDLSSVVSETPHLYKYTFSFDFNNFDDDPSTNVNYFWGILYSSYNAVGDNGDPAYTDIVNIFGPSGGSKILNVSGTINIGSTVYSSAALYSLYYTETDDLLTMDIYYPAEPSAASFAISNAQNRYVLSIEKQQLF